MVACWCSIVGASELGCVAALLENVRSWCVGVSCYIMLGIFSALRRVLAGGEEVKKEAQVVGARGIFSSLVGSDVLFWRPILCTGGPWA